MADKWDKYAQSADKWDQFAQAAPADTAPNAGLAPPTNAIPPLGTLPKPITPYATGNDDFVAKTTLRGLNAGANMVQHPIQTLTGSSPMGLAANGAVQSYQDLRNFLKTKQMPTVDDQVNRITGQLGIDAPAVREAAQNHDYGQLAAETVVPVGMALIGGKIGRKISPNIPAPDTQTAADNLVKVLNPSERQAAKTVRSVNDAMPALSDAARTSNPQSVQSLASAITSKQNELQGTFRNILNSPATNPPQGYVPATRGTIAGRENFQGHAGTPETWFIEGHGPNAEAGANVYANASVQAAGGGVQPKLIKGYVRESSISPKFEGGTERMGGVEGDPIAANVSNPRDFIPANAPVSAHPVDLTPIGQEMLKKITPGMKISNPDLVATIQAEADKYIGKTATVGELDSLREDLNSGLEGQYKKDGLTRYDAVKSPQHGFRFAEAGAARDLLYKTVGDLTGKDLSGLKMLQSNLRNIQGKLNNVAAASTAKDMANNATPFAAKAADFGANLLDLHAGTAVKKGISQYLGSARGNNAAVGRFTDALQQNQPRPAVPVIGSLAASMANDQQ